MSSAAWVPESGACLLRELFPDWKLNEAPVKTARFGPLLGRSLRFLSRFIGFSLISLIFIDFHLFFHHFP